MQNQHLVPEVILNIVDQYRKSTGQNERFSLEARLEAIIVVCKQALSEPQRKERILK